MYYLMLFFESPSKSSARGSVIEFIEFEFIKFNDVKKIGDDPLGACFNFLLQPIKVPQT